jgi:hypothetical protein
MEESEVDEADPVGESFGVLTLLFLLVEGADSAVTVRFIAAWRGSAVVVLILAVLLVEKQAQTDLDRFCSVQEDL